MSADGIVKLQDWILSLFTRKIATQLESDIAEQIHPITYLQGKLLKAQARELDNALEVFGPEDPLIEKIEKLHRLQRAELANKETLQ